MKIVMVGDGGVSEAVRIKMPAGALAMRHQVQVFSYTQNQIPLVPCDVAILSRCPHVELVKQFKNNGARVLIDIDDDFFAIPPQHPGYESVGKNSPFAKGLRESIRHCDGLIVSTPELAERYQTLAPIRAVIPNGWSDRDGWSRTKVPHRGLVIAWAGTITHRQDFSLVQETLISAAARAPHVRIRIGGDPEIYQLLGPVPEYQKTFLPMLPFRNYVTAFQDVDLWLAPLVDDPFNRAKSDVKLVEAGATGTPFLASCLPQYLRWNAGGLYALPGEWSENLAALIDSPQLRADLAEEGWKKAQERNITQLVALWERACKGDPK